MSEGKKPSLLRRFCKRYFIDALSAMALGLFATLIIGLILQQLSKIPGLSLFADLAAYAQKSEVVGAAIAVAIAYGLKVKPLAMLSCAAVGAYANGIGGPLGCYIAAVFAAEAGNAIAGRTKVDIVLVPICGLVAGGLVTIVTGPWVKALMAGLSQFINSATLLTPIPMGIIVSVVVGLALTAPISSAALCAMIFITADGTALPQGLALAAGAATVGCCCQMVGFAVTSFKDNGVGGLIAQGLGTSMLQVANILRHPAILLPQVVASAIIGPLATTVLPMYNAGAAAGMGTSGLVGQIGTYSAMIGSAGAGEIILKMLLLHLVLPAAISLGVYFLLRKIGWIKDGYMKLN